MMLLLITYRRHAIRHFFRHDIFAAIDLLLRHCSRHAYVAAYR